MASPDQTVKLSTATKPGAASLEPGPIIPIKECEGHRSEYAENCLKLQDRCWVFVFPILHYLRRIYDGGQHSGHLEPPSVRWSNQSQVSILKLLRLFESY